MLRRGRWKSVPLLQLNPIELFSLDPPWDPPWLKCRARQTGTYKGLFQNRRRYTAGEVPQSRILGGGWGYGSDAARRKIEGKGVASTSCRSQPQIGKAGKPSPLTHVRLPMGILRF